MNSVPTGTVWLLFQFTHPVRGATLAWVTNPYTLRVFQFTHPVRGATEHLIVECDGLTVSIHAPRAGCD